MNIFKQKPINEPAYTLPPLDLLNDGEQAENVPNVDDLITIKSALDGLNINTKYINTLNGATLTVYMFDVLDVSASTKIARLEKSLQLMLRCDGVRVLINNGLRVEVPKTERKTVNIKSTLNRSGVIPLTLGATADGQPLGYDLANAPHLLISGTTGSGKSVCINSILISLLMNKTPNELKMILIDPKSVELGNYNGVEHLQMPVITETEQAVSVLNRCIYEMENRYKHLQKCGCKSIDDYCGDDMPRLVIIIDEFADLILQGGKCIEKPVTRLLQKSRACGIHLIIATQRPSVKVIPGIIKANMPTRIAFTTASITDSKVIIDRKGAEQLQGKGDGLFQACDNISLTRFQACYVSGEEIERVINWTTKK